MRLLQESSTSCPRCGAAIPVGASHEIAWCDRCDWNVIPESRREKPTLLEEIYKKLGKKFSKKLFEKVRRDASLAPALTIPKTLAYTICLSVHGITLGIFVLGVYLLVWRWPNGWALFFGIVCLGIVYVLRIRPVRWPKNTVSRSDYPALYGLLDRMAKELGTPPVSGLIIDEEYNASIAEIGIRGRKLVTLGLPLFSVLTPQERIALLGHEFGHGLNRDSRRGFVFWTTLCTLESWYKILKPDYLWRPGTGFFGLKMVPGHAFMYGLATVVRLLLSGMLHLVWHESQRAEYLADLTAARLGSTQVTVGAWEKLDYGECLWPTVQDVALNGRKDGVYHLLNEKIKGLSEREKERLRRKNRIYGSQLDATHPPTAYRIEFLKSHPVDQPRFVLSTKEHDAIEREISGLKAEMQRRLIEKYEASLYR